MVDLKPQVCAESYQKLGSVFGFFPGLGVSQPVMQILEQGQPVPVEEFLDHYHHLGEEPRSRTDFKKEKL